MRPAAALALRLNGTSGDGDERELDGGGVHYTSQALCQCSLSVECLHDHPTEETTLLEPAALLEVVSAQYARFEDTIGHRELSRLFL